MTSVDDEFQELRKMTDVLRSDVDSCYSALIEADTQPARRQLCRTFFAQVEGVMFMYKRVALLAAEADLAQFSFAERALLKEEQYDLNSKGEAVTRSARLPFASNFLFSMRAYVQGSGRKANLPTHKNGWDQFLKSAKVRDRLMHPKSVASLTITDAELRSLIDAHNWVLECREAVTGQNENAPTPLPE